MDGRFRSGLPEVCIMMKTGCTGTESPKNGTGGLRRVVLALAVLLLTCVLMAGAVSAEDWHYVTTYAELKSNLSDGNYTKLTKDISATADDGRINITGKNSTLDLNGCTLTMTMGTSAFSIGNDTATPQNKATLIVLDSSPAKTGTINSTDNYLFFVKNASTVHLQSGIFQANHPVIAGNANGEWGSPTFIVDPGVKLTSTGSVAVFLPAEGTKATITGATITGLKGGISIAAGDVTIKNTSISVTGDLNGVTGEWRSGPCEDGSAISIHKLTTSYPGDLTLRLLGTTSLTSAHGAAFHNYIGSDQTSLDTVTVTIADTVNFNGKAITSAIFGTTCTGDGGVFQDTSDNKLLYPGLNQTGVVWGGDSTSVYTLSITEPGSYKLMDGFATTGSGIQITADGVTLDGSKKKITTAGTLDSYILKVAVDVENTEGVKGVTLQNLDISSAASSAVGLYGGITVGETKKVSVPVTLKDSTVDLSGVVLETAAMNPAVYFVSAPGSQITGNTIIAGTTAGSSTRCVVVDGGSDVTVSDNKLTLGSVTGDAVAVGVEIKGNDVDRVTVSGNRLATATGSDSGEAPRAVKITAKDTGSQKTFTVSKNNIQFGGKGTTVEVLLSTFGITEEANAQVNLNVEENTGSTASVVMLNKGDTNGDDTLLTSAITLTGNIYNPALTSSEEVAVAGGFTEPGSAQPNIDVTHVNPAPSSSGNMNNAYRVLFNDGATTLSVQTDLSSGDKLTKPETPVKDGYTFAGWYKDSACTQAWDFETGIPGDMTLYAKWTAAGSSSTGTEATATPTKTATAVTTPQPTKTQTAAATTSAPEATTAAGVSPTLTQAPAPVAGALFGLLAAGVLLRRRFQ